MLIKCASITVNDWKKTQYDLTQPNGDVYFSYERDNFLKYCLDCGAEIYCEIEWENEQVGRYSPAAEKRLEVARRYRTYFEKKKREYYEDACPICSGKQFVDLGTSRYHSEKSICESFEEHAIEQVEIDKNTAQEKAELLAKYDEGSSMSVSGKNIHKDQSEWLKEYISNLIKLENNIYSVKTRLSELYSHYIGNHREVLQYAGRTVSEQREAVESAQRTYQDLLNKYEIFKSKPIEPIDVYYPSEPVKPIMETPRFYNKRKVLERNADRTAKYHEKLEEYHRQVAEVDAYKADREVLAKKVRESTLATTEKQVADAKTNVDTLSKALEETRKLGLNIPSPAKNAEIILLDEINQAEELLGKLCDARNTLYGYDVIFSKYRNVVALSTFYEYLAAGRCETLEGTTGAYNLYENEYRANLIITQLDKVIDSLEKIKENQYLLYTSMQYIGSQLNDLNMTTSAVLSSVRKIEKNTEEIVSSLDVISYNTKKAAYYSKVNAELTNSLGYMIALNG